jgi:hypothetical protein
MVKVIKFLNKLGKIVNNKKVQTLKFKHRSNDIIIFTVRIDFFIIKNYKKLNKNKKNVIIKLNRAKVK